MNEQLAAIKARRAAITPGVWRWGGYHDYENYDVHVFDDDDKSVTYIANHCYDVDAKFIAAAPADVDTLLAEVERLDRVLTGQREYWFNEYRKAEAERDALATGREIQAALIDTLTAQRDALAAQLREAQDAAKRQAAYISACVDSDGCYRP